MELTKKSRLSFEDFTTTQYGKMMEIYDFSANLPASLYTETTGLRLSETQYRSCRLADSHMTFEDYLLNCKRGTMDITLMRGINNYGAFGVRASLQQRKLKEDEYHESGQAIKLPQYRNINTPLSTAIRSRRSIREMSAKKASINDLSTILFHGCGVSGDFRLLSAEDGETDVLAVDMDEYSKVRTNPSGGGLYPVYLYIWVQNCEGLDDGIYLYLPLTHSLAIVQKNNENDNVLLQNLSNYGLDLNSENFRFSIFYVYNIYENARKYGDMALLFSLIEAGEISQNIHLACTGLGLASCDIGGYEKVNFEQMLNLDGLSKHLIHLTIVGCK